MAQDMRYCVGAKAIIEDERGRILLLHIARPQTAEHYWDLPGGRVQEGESTVEALRREVAEETGIRDMVIGQSLGIMMTPARLSLPAEGPTGLLFAGYKCKSQTCNLRTEPNMRSQWCERATAAKLLRTSPNIPMELIAAIES